jgi:hypothetical protein
VIQIFAVGMAIGVLMCAGGCHDTGTQPPLSGNGRNLISNSSFERQGEPTLEGWTVESFNQVEIVAPPAPGGGEFSLELTGQGHDPPTRVMTNVGEADNGGVYQLSAYVRGCGGTNGGGFIRLTVGDEYPSLDGSAQTHDAAWTLLSLTDTIVAGPDDSLKVWLSSFHYPGPTWGAGQFDLVTLERVEP